MGGLARNSGGTPPWQSTTIYGKESRDWPRVPCPYGGVEFGGGPLYGPVHIIHCGSPTGYILCLVLDWSTVCGSL